MEKADKTISVGILSAVEVRRFTIAVQNLVMLVWQEVVQITQERDLYDEQRQKRCRPSSICRCLLHLMVYPFRWPGVTDLAASICEVNVFPARRLTDNQCICKKKKPAEPLFFSKKGDLPSGYTQFHQLAELTYIRNGTTLYGGVVLVGGKQKKKKKRSPLLVNLHKDEIEHSSFGSKIKDEKGDL